MYKLLKLPALCSWCGEYGAKTTETPIGRQIVLCPDCVKRLRNRRRQ